MKLDIVIFGLSITSSWGNGHATTYRGLMRELVSRGHNVLFLERDMPWYADNRDLPRPPYGTTRLYSSLAELRNRYRVEVRNADLVIVGSYVPEGIELGEWVVSTASGMKAFYDIDTPVTLAGLDSGRAKYISPGLIRRYDLYLSFTGGPILGRLKRKYGAAAARPLYCSVDPSVYMPIAEKQKWDLGYMGTYSADRQPSLEKLLLGPARLWKAGRFTVAGPEYPESLRWPDNVERTDHVPPSGHSVFYNRQRFTLNITRTDMIRAGYSPSVRLFEAAACGTPIISDYWDGLETLFEPGREILICNSDRDVLRYIREIPEQKRAEIGSAARRRVLAAHTSSHRVSELESYLSELMPEYRVAAGSGKRA